jgi:hypothetical protein
MTVSCDVYVPQVPLDHLVESSAISMILDSESGHSAVVAQGLGSIDRVPTTNNEETSSNDIASTPTPMTMMARTVPQRRCNVSHTPQHILLSLNQVRNYSKSL